MKYEKRHHAYVHNRGGASVPAEKMTNDLGDMMPHYIGTFSEYNPLYLANNYDNLALVVKKDTGVSVYQKDFQCVIEPEEFGGYHGGGFNCNGGIILTKQDLLKITASMDDTDTLMFLNPDEVNSALFKTN